MSFKRNQRQIQLSETLGLRYKIIALDFIEKQRTLGQYWLSRGGLVRLDTIIALGHTSTTRQ